MLVVRRRLRLLGIGAIALMIPFVMGAGGGYLQGSAQQVVNPGFNFEGIDAILSEMAAEPDVAGMLGGQLQSFVPQSGHPTGFFMVNLIEEELGAEAIREVVRNRRESKDEGVCHEYREFGD